MTRGGRWGKVHLLGSGLWGLGEEVGFKCDGKLLEGFSETVTGLFPI